MNPRSPVQPVEARPVEAAGTLREIAVYRRRVRASLERVWENVLDWEHLPWLHHSSFASIDCTDAGPWGWRARVSYPAAPGQTPGRASIELLVDRAEARYVVRTLDGLGEGGEIWTSLSEHSRHETDIHVSFRSVDLPLDRAETLGRALVRLYTQLWDEDEGMMREREARLSDPRAIEAPESVELGPRSDLRPRLPLVVELGGRSFRIVESDGALLAHSTLCPHRLGPLGDSPVEDGSIRCPWHGVRFDLRTGRGCDGSRLRLSPTPTIEVDEVSGMVRLTWPDGVRD